MIYQSLLIPKSRNATSLSRRRACESTAVIVTDALPNLLRLEERVALGLRFITFDGHSVRSSDGNFTPEDEALLESLIFDSAEHCFLAQSEGFATRYLGSGFSNGTEREASYDLYQITDLISLRDSPRLRD
jgi:hypothetical protein